MTPEEILPEVVDSTFLGAFRVCPQRAYFEYVLGLRDPAPAVDLLAGGAFAAAREALYGASYSGALRPATIDAAREAFDLSWGDFQPPPDSKSPKTRARVWEAVVSYAREYDPPNDRLEPLRDKNGLPTFEWRFAVPLDTTTTGFDLEWPLHPTTGRPFVYGGRTDAIGMWDGRLPVVLDDKTTARFEAVPTWVAGLQMRAQFIGYVWAATKVLGREVDTVVVRQTAIRASGVEHRESPLIGYSRFLQERWLRTTASTLRALCEAWRRGAFEAVLGDACVSWSRPCEFMGACRSAEPAEQLSGFVERRWNPVAERP